jgi:small subunit ribosomal protein S15
MDSTLDFLQKGEEGDEDEEDDELDMFEIYEDSPDIDIPYDLIAQIEAKEAQALAEKGVSGAEINQAAIEAAVAKWRKHDKDTGSAEVQIVIANEKVKYLTKHLLANRKDMSAKRGLNALVTMRKSFLNYLYQSDPSKATDMAKELGIRFRPKGRLWDKDSKYGAYKNTKSKYQKIRAAKRAQRKPVDAEPVSA